jgi:membrane-bound ClpP family serine protease
MTKRGHLRTLVAAGPINGAVEELQALLGEAAENEADAAVIVGDLAAPGGGKASLRAIFRALGEAQLPTFGCRAPRTHR